MSMPELQDGWSTAFKLGDVECTIRSNHKRHKRPARASEMIKQLVRGRRPTMIETVVHQWSLRVVIDKRVRTATIFRLPDGRFQLAGDKARWMHMSLRDATMAFVAKLRVGQS